MKVVVTNGTNRAIPLDRGGTVPPGVTMEVESSNIPSGSARHLEVSAVENKLNPRALQPPAPPAPKPAPKKAAPTLKKAAPKAAKKGK